MRMGELVASQQYALVTNHQGGPLLSVLPILKEHERALVGCDRVWGLKVPKVPCSAHELQAAKEAEAAKEAAILELQAAKKAAIQVNLLIKSDKSSTGFKGVRANEGRIPG
jgi:hypothetical protein